MFEEPLCEVGLLAVPVSPAGAELEPDSACFPAEEGVVAADSGEGYFSSEEEVVAVGSFNSNFIVNDPSEINGAFPLPLNWANLAVIVIYGFAFSVFAVKV
ncbi:hypothetical protein [Mycoplasma struthionis]|uniref:Uncharacterized protein n=1 Tax=Mycoplasma struthionis TaxID=538220 RepID=A0A3G8LIJ9_9MOLU|nr:hypothetical protein [Mycoplasma struthionis]AZG68488.1 hypothetical protein EGN60_00660 [Mycoplasma struthionis]